MAFVFPFSYRRLVWSLTTNFSSTILSLVFPGGPVVKNPPVNAGDVGLIPGQEDPLEKAMATHSSTLAWGVLWTEEPGGLQSVGLQKLDMTE